MCGPCLVLGVESFLLQRCRRERQGLVHLFNIAAVRGGLVRFLYWCRLFIMECMAACCALEPTTSLAYDVTKIVVIICRTINNYKILKNNKKQKVSEFINVQASAQLLTVKSGIMRHKGRDH